MNVKKIFIFITVLILMSGCTQPGPMQTPSGLLKTKQFEPIFIQTIKDGSETVLFKEYTTMYEHGDLQYWGVFTITDQGVYFALWDTIGFEYNVLFKLNKNEIASLSEDLISRSLWVDSELLIIKDKNNNEVGFALNGKRAAYTTLNRLINNKSNRIEKPI